MKTKLFEEIPEPVQRPESSQDRMKKQRRFIVVINDFALFYLLLHKMIMPVFTYYQMSIKPVDGLHVDWWWVSHFILAILLRRKKGDDIYLRAVCWTVLSGTLLLLLFGIGDYRWQTFSLWLTSAASFSVVAVILTRSRFVFSSSKVARLVFLGSVLAGVSLGSLNHFLENIGYGEEKKEEARHLDETDAVLLDLFAQKCGLSRFVVDPLQSQHLPVDHAGLIQIQPCGFSPQVLRMASLSEIKIENKSDRYLNIKLNRLDGHDWHPVFNKPLLDKQSLNFREEFSDSDVLFLFSDSNPDLGVQVILGPKAEMDTIFFFPDFILFDHQKKHLVFVSRKKI